MVVVAIEEEAVVLRVAVVVVDDVVLVFDTVVVVRIVVVVAKVVVIVTPVVVVVVSRVVVVESDSVQPFRIKPFMFSVTSKFVQTRLSKGFGSAQFLFVYFPSLSIQEFL